MEITIINTQKKIPVSQRRIKRAILKALSIKDLQKSGAINICFVSTREIRRLNIKYTGRKTATDVLVFDVSDPADRGSRISADIAVSADQALHNARIFNTTVAYELDLYAVHGILHLLGYDDSTCRQREAMQKKAESILSSLHATRKAHLKV